MAIIFLSLINTQTSILVKLKWLKLKWLSVKAWWNKIQSVKLKHWKRAILSLSYLAFWWWDLGFWYIQDGTLSNNSNSFQPLSFVTKSSIINVAGVLKPLMPEVTRVEQNTHCKQLFSLVIALLMLSLLPYVWT